MRAAGLLLLAVLAGCAPRVPAPRPVAEASPPVGTCRVGPDGGIPVADRGIGGTGMLADRGIGGTGQRTGIVGVITGFASVCLAGQEVQYAPGLPVTVDGRPAALDVLRAGQVATIEAQGARPAAVAVAVRHEISGPVERVEADGALLVAGQRVVPPPGAPAPGAGAWVMVSGFHLVDGSIAATRLDLRGPGEVLVRGILRNERGRLWIGLVEVRPGRGQLRQAGVPVLAVGRLNGGVLEADTVEPDGLLLDPAAFFGPRVGVLIVEGYAEGGGFWFGRRRLGAGFAAGRALARLERGPGGFAPAFVRPYGAGGVGPGGFGPAPRFEPAPRFDRAFDRGERRMERRDGRGEGLRDRRQERRGGEDGPGGGPGFGPGGFQRR